jgi:anti-sigma B factor antagonist
MIKVLVVDVTNEYIIFPNGIILSFDSIALVSRGSHKMDVGIKSLSNCELISINGRIDSNTAPQLSDTLHHVTDQNKYRIILELSNVSFISSAGLRVMIDIQKICKRDNRGEVMLVCIPPRVFETFEVAGFVPLFKFFDNATTALTAF